MQSELRIARELQHAMLPLVFPTLPQGVSSAESAIGFASAYQPAGMVSGDFFDIVPLSDTRIGVLICDVMGHDVSAALVTAMIRSLVEERGTEAVDPAHLLATINRALHRILRHGASETFVTAFYLIADATTGEVIYANAGHPVPLLLHRSRHAVAALGRKGTPGPALGLFAEAAYTSHRAHMAPGDVALLFTDGLFEVEGPGAELYTHQRLANAVRRKLDTPTPRLLPELIDEIRDFCGRSTFGDDVCVVGMEFRHPLPPRAA